MMSKLSKWAILMLALVFAAGCLDSDDDDDDDGIGDLSAAQEPAELGSADDVARVAAGLDELDAGGFAGDFTDPSGQLPSDMGPQALLQSGAATAADPLLAESSSLDEVCMNEDGSYEEQDLGGGVTEASYDNCMVFFFVLNGDVRVEQTGDSELITYGDGSTPFSLSLEDPDSDDSFTLSFSGEMYVEDPTDPAPDGWGMTTYTLLDYEFDYDVSADGEDFWVRSFTDDLEIYEDGNWTRINGSYGMDSSIQCGSGAVEVSTLEDLYEPTGAPGWTQGQVQFSNDNGQTATVTFQDDQTVIIETDDGQTDQRDLSEFQTTCELDDDF